MLLDVGGHAGLVLLDVGRAVEVRVHGRQAALAGVVEEDPAHRVGDREHPPAAGAQHPVHLAHQRRRVGHERDRAERGAGDVERRRRRTAGRARRPAPAARVPRCARRPSAACRSMPADRSKATGRAPWVAQPAGAGRRAAPTSSTRRPRHVAEQPGVGLAQALRAPDEVHVAEERAVFGLVVVGVGVPPAAVGPPGLGVAHPAPGHPAVVVHRLTLGPRPIGTAASAIRDSSRVRGVSDSCVVPSATTVRNQVDQAGTCRSTIGRGCCDARDSRGRFRRLFGFRRSSHERPGGLARCGNAHGRLVDALADRVPRQGAGPRSSEPHR